jgi:Prophage tail length tape measure protein
MDFANLGINIDSSSAAQASTALDQLARTGEQVETRVERSMGDITESMNRAAMANAQSAERLSRQTRASVSNLTYQISDIGQMLAVGQSPFILMMQQGDQVSGALRDLSANGKGGVIGGIGAALRGLLNPITLATYAFIGLGSLAFYWLTGTEEKALSLEKQVKNLSGTFDSFRGYVKTAAMDMESLAEQYGSAAEKARELAIFQAENAREKVRGEFDAFVGTNMDIFGEGEYLKGFEKDRVADYLGIDRSFFVFTQEARDARDELDVVIDDMIGAVGRLKQASTFEEQAAALREYLTVFSQAADLDGQRSASEIERIDLISQILDKMYQQIGAEERLAEVTNSTAAAAAGQSASLVQFQSQVVSSTTQAIGAVSGLISKAFGSSTGIGNAIIDGFIQGMNSKAGSLYASARDIASNVSSTFKGMLGIQSPSKVFREHGRDVGAGLEEGLEDSQSGVTSAIEGLASGVTNAITGLFDGSLRSAKDFMNAIKDAFKRLIGDLINMAISNPIRIAFGLSPLGGAASAGTGGLGGAGGLLSNIMGGFGSAGGGIFGALGGGTGLLGGLGNALSGGLGNVFNVFGNAAAAGGGLAATIGAAIPILGGIALVLSAFKKKVTTLDSGMRLTVNGMDTLVETFSKTKTTKFWGLSKKISTRFGQASDDIADPVEAAVKDIFKYVATLADTIGLAGKDILKDFSSQITVSTMGMSSADAQKVIEGAFTQLSDEMARLILATGEGFIEQQKKAEEELKKSTTTTNTRSIMDILLGTMMGQKSTSTKPTATKGSPSIFGIPLLSLFGRPTAPVDPLKGFTSKFALAGETATQTLERLASSLVAVNEAWKLMDFTLREVSITGAGAAANLVGLVGGLENFGSLTEYFYQNFFSEAERRAKATEALRETLAAFGEELPKSKKEYRDLLAKATAEGDDELAAALLKSAAAFVFITDKANQFAKSTNQNTLFRDRAEQIFAQTSAEYQKAVETLLSREDRDLLRGIITAVREGDINQARITSRLVAIEERRDLDPGEAA